MNNLINIHDSDIQLVENLILKKYNDNRCDYTKFSCLLELRKKMINRRVLAYQKNILQDIIDFNDALTETLKQMYDKVHRVWDKMKSDDECDYKKELIANCFLYYDYPELHPIQSKEYEELWYTLFDSGWNPSYEDGVTLFPLRLTSTSVNDESFDALIGMDCIPNWNEGLDKELTKDLHLTSAFHNLFKITKFAITDFIYVRKFTTDIRIYL